MEQTMKGFLTCVGRMLFHYAAISLGYIIGAIIGAAPLIALDLYLGTDFGAGLSAISGVLCGWALSAWVVHRTGL